MCASAAYVAVSGGEGSEPSAGGGKAEALDGGGVGTRWGRRHSMEALDETALSDKVAATGGADGAAKGGSEEGLGWRGGRDPGRRRSRRVRR